MAMTETVVSVSAHMRWWVRPLIKLVPLLCEGGLMRPTPASLNRLIALLVRYGVKLRTELKP